MSQTQELTIVSPTSEDCAVANVPRKLNGGPCNKEISIRSRALQKLFDLLPNDSEELFRCISDPVHFEILHSLISKEGEITSGYAETLAAIHRSISKIPFQKSGLVTLFRSGISEMKSHTDILSAAARVRANASELRESVRISQSVDSGLIQDGFLLRYELIVVSRDGCLAILHVGRCDESGQERCYVWGIEGWKIDSLLAPHSGVLGDGGDQVVNLVDKNSTDAQNAVVRLLKMDPASFLEEVRKYDAADSGMVPHLVDMKRVTSIRAFINEKGLDNFCEVAALEAVGQRTAEFLAHFAAHSTGCEVLFNDPARSHVASRRRVSVERMELARRVLLLVHSLIANEQLPPVISRRVSERIQDLETALEKRRGGNSTSRSRVKTRKTARRTSPRSESVRSVAQAPRNEVPRQQEIMPLSASEKAAVAETRVRIAEARKTRRAKAARTVMKTNGSSPIQRKTVQISVDQLALF